MCTTFYMPFKNHRISGRTMDFENMRDAAYLYFMPKHEDYMPSGIRKVLSEIGINLYEQDGGSRYSFIGVANEWGSKQWHTQTRVFADGLNECGIAVSMQWLPGSEFPYSPQDKENNTLFLSWYLASFILGNIGNLDELNGLFAPKGPLKVFELEIGIEKKKLPFHFNVQDVDGNSVVIEFINKEVKIYDSRDKEHNPFLHASGALTNYPPYDEQVKNYQSFLLQHEGIGPTNRQKGQNDSQEVNGSGLLGMPGDGTPISRFIRTHLLMETVYNDPIENMDAIGATIQMLGNVAVPIGTVAPHEHPDEVGDSTLWSAVRDHKNLKYYYFDQHNNQLRMVDLGTLMKSNDAKIKSTPLETNELWYIDETSRLKERQRSV